jgi:hypothetical protein
VRKWLHRRARLRRLRKRRAELALQRDRAYERREYPPATLHDRIARMDREIAGLGG